MGTMIPKSSVLTDSSEISAKTVQVPPVWHEYRMNPYREGRPIMLKAPDRQYTFQTVYGFLEPTVDRIQATGHMRGLTGCDVFSDRIFIDVDTGDEAAIVEDLLQHQSFRVEVWSTGNRGLHFEIPIEPMMGPNVIYSQKRWLRLIGVWDSIDTSIYKEGGLIRCHGAIHAKTGRPKIKVREHPGVTLALPTLVPPPRPVQQQHTVKGDSQLLYRRNLLYSRGPGQRHTHCFILWKRGLEADRPIDAIHDDIRWWNQWRAIPPHPEYIIERKLRGFRDE